jgi:hypothetical protein
MADVSHTTRLTTRMTGDAKHSAAATFTLDVLRVLYEKVLDVSPESVPDADRDRRYLSKGHGPMAYHAVLAERGSSRSRGWPAGRVRLTARAPPGPQPGARRRDLLRLARPRTAARRRYGAGPAGAGHSLPAGPRRTARRRRDGGRGGPVLDAVVAVIAGRDVTVLYSSTVRPFDARGRRSGAGQPGRGARRALARRYLRPLRGRPPAGRAAPAPSRCSSNPAA